MVPHARRDRPLIGDEDRPHLQHTSGHHAAILASAGHHRSDLTSWRATLLRLITALGGFVVARTRSRKDQKMMKSFVLSALGMLVLLKDSRNRDERGLSQSSENAILLAGAVAVALIVVTVITNYVTAKLPK